MVVSTAVYMAFLVVHAPAHVGSANCKQSWGIQVTGPQTSLTAWSNSWRTAPRFPGFLVSAISPQAMSSAFLKIPNSEKISKASVSAGAPYNNNMKTSSTLSSFWNFSLPYLLHKLHVVLPNELGISKIWATTHYRLLPGMVSSGKGTKVSVTSSPVPRTICKFC